MKYKINYKGQEIEVEQLPNGKFKKPDLAKKMEGSYGGFQPKPAVEVIIVVMKPLSEAGYLKQAMTDGKGVTWLDDCRVPYASDNDEQGVAGDLGRKASFGYTGEKIVFSNNPNFNNDYKMTGRFPANLLISDDILGEHTKFFDLDAWAQKNLPFIICPKAPKKEKNAGMDHMPDKDMLAYNKCRVCGTIPCKCKTKDSDPADIRTNLRPKNTITKNIHPTVKPMKLMSYLITLGSREGDVILDPFAGSGTTACSAIMLRRNFVAIEKEDEYIPIIEARVKHYLDIIKNEPLTV